MHVRPRSDIPLRLFWKVIGWPIGLCFYVHFLLVRWTSKVEIQGVAPDSPAIYVNWHRHLPFLIQHHGKFGRWLMVSSSPYMTPIAIWCELSGLELVRGASGQGGAVALEGLKSALTEGKSVMLGVDGPAGPAFKVKRGCLELAQETGHPIIPVSYQCRRGREKRRWDRLIYPRYFDEVRISYGAPLYLDRRESLESAARRVEMALNGLDPLLV